MVLNIDAAGLHLGRRAAAQPLGAAVCGLGLHNMTSREVEGIVRASFAALRRDVRGYAQVRIAFIALLGTAPFAAGTSFVA